MREFLNTLPKDAKIELISGGRGAGKSYRVYEQIIKDVISSPLPLTIGVIEFASYRPDDLCRNLCNVAESLNVDAVTNIKQGVVVVKLGNTCHTIHFLTPSTNMLGMNLDYLYLENLDVCKNDWYLDNYKWFITGFRGINKCKSLTITFTPSPIPISDLNFVLIKLLADPRTQMTRMSTLDNEHLSGFAACSIKRTCEDDPVKYVTQVLGHVVLG